MILRPTIRAVIKYDFAYKSCFYSDTEVFRHECVIFEFPPLASFPQNWLSAKQ